MHKTTERLVMEAHAIITRWITEGYEIQEIAMIIGLLIATNAVESVALVNVLEEREAQGSAKQKRGVEDGN